MNILIAGIPLPELLLHIQKRHSHDITFFVCECRPFEMQVSQAIAQAQASSINITVLTDNMMEALLQTHPIEEVWGLYAALDTDAVTAINGAHTAALLAKQHRIPFYMYPIDHLQETPKGQLASESVMVPGASYIDYVPDVFSRQLITEVVEHG